MVINLIASDTETYQLCRDILAEMAESGQSWTLLSIAANEAWRPADLHIWDFRPGLTISEPITGNPVRHLFLVAAISAQAATSLRAERDEILQCLIQANLKLQEYDQDRTAFLARAVHDFRAPLTALNGYCGLLLSGSSGRLNETQDEILRRM